MNMRETWRNGLGTVLVLVVFIVDAHMCCVLKWVDLLIERMVAHQESQERKRVGKREKKGWKGESGLRESVFFFGFFVTVFHSILSPFQFTMSPLFFLRSYSHTTVHTIPSHTQHTTQPHLCAVLFLCVTVCALIPHSTKQHNTMQPCNHHM